MVAYQLKEKLLVISVVHLDKYITSFIIYIIHNTGDCWLFNMENNMWTEKKLEKVDKRRWHQCVHIDNELIAVGGIQTDIRSSQQDSAVGSD